MKNSKAFYRSTLATAIVMALSAPAFAADNAVSTTPVTLDKDTTLEQDVVISGTTQITAATINAKNNRTKTIVMSVRFPEKQKKVLSLLLAGHSWEYSAQFLKTGIRQIWLTEQSLKKRWGIPDSMSLREALLLSSNNFHGDGNALETTNAMTLRENGNTNRYSVVVNAGTQALSLHKYK